MRIYVENTPNTNILKFICDETLTYGSLEFDKNSTEITSPLAQTLLAIPFVLKVFITANFVALEKTDAVQWEEVVEELKAIINQHLIDNKIIVKEIKKEPYTVYAEMTPNPSVMKFVANKTLVPNIIEIKSVEQSSTVPLAEEIFKFPFVKEVFLHENYISVTKKEDYDWSELALELREFILYYLQNGGKVVSDNYEVKTLKKQENTYLSKEFTPIEIKINEIIEEYIQPAVANDGGNISLIEFDEETKTAKMLLQGACSGCPSSTLTLKNGIETMLKQMLPNTIESVEAVNG